MRGNLLLFACFLGSSLAADPTAELNGAVITGINVGAVSKFLGIPYASPPIGDLRFRKPEPFEIFSDRDAKSYGPACPAQKLSSIPGLCTGSANVSSELYELHNSPYAQSEDCLSINIIRPLFAGPQSNYPVVVFIFGGAFEIGDTQSHDAMGVRMVQRSTALGTPVIFVSMNYRVSAFGFLGGKEVFEEEVGNLGLWDQRVALRWVKRHIASFGGNSSRIMLWGHSSGSISVALQMIGPDSGANKEDLFQSAFMQSGTVIPVGDIRDGQRYYDFLVNETGCGRPKTDTLSCLRGLKYPILKAAIDKSPNYLDYQSLSLAWVPRTDGIFLKEDPQKLVESGSVAKVPFVAGCTDDEGTLFAFSSKNVTTEGDFRKYVSDIFAPKAPIEELEKLWTLYPSTPSEGSPFDTGNKTVVSPQFKRMAAFQGDVVFQAPTRFFLQNLSRRQKMWSFLSKRSKILPCLGSFHGSDFVLQIMEDYIIRFAVTHDPNNGTGPVWPQYTEASPQRYTFPSLGGSPTVALDTQRAPQMAFLSNLSLFYPI